MSSGSHSLAADSHDPTSGPPSALRLSTQPGDIFVIALTHQSVEADCRERLALAAPGAAALRATLAAEASLREHLVLTTCNRLEVYGVADSPTAPERVAAHLCRQLDLPATALAAGWIAAAEEAAAAHLFAVASGLESQLLGETEILGQVKDAYDGASRTRTLGPRLHRLLQKCFQTAKLVRSETGIARGQISIGNVAVELAARIFGDLTTARLLLVGSGDVGELTAKAFFSRGAHCLTVTSRNPDAAARLAEAVRAQTVPFGDWIGALPGQDVVVTATSAPHLILTEATVQAALRTRRGRPLFLIDLAVPRDIDPEVAALPDVYLYTLEDLAAIARENLAARQVELGRARELIAERAAAVVRRR